MLQKIKRPGAVLQEAKGTGLVLQEAKGTGAVLQEAKGPEAVLQKVKEPGAVLQEAKGPEAALEEQKKGAESQLLNCPVYLQMLWNLLWVSPPDKLLLGLPVSDSGNWFLTESL